MITKYLKNIGLKSRKAFENLSKIDVSKKNRILKNYIYDLKKNKKKIIKENSKDLKICKKKELIERLIINEKSI